MRLSSYVPVSTSRSRRARPYRQELTKFLFGGLPLCVGERGGRVSIRLGAVRQSRWPAAATAVYAGPGGPGLG